MHRARTIAAISKAAEHLPLVELARVLVRFDHFIIADNLSKAGFSWGCVSALDLEERTIWIADARRDDGKRFVMRTDELLTAFLELEAAIRVETNPSERRKSA
jgi:hypothetical protein